MCYLWRRIAWNIHTSKDLYACRLSFIHTIQFTWPQANYTYLKYTCDPVLHVLSRVSQMSEMVFNIRHSLDGLSKGLDIRGVNTTCFIEVNRYDWMYLSQFLSHTFYMLICKFKTNKLSQHKYKRMLDLLWLLLRAFAPGMCTRSVCKQETYPLSKPHMESFLNLMARCSCNVDPLLIRIMMLAQKHTDFGLLRQR